MAAASEGADPGPPRDPSAYRPSQHLAERFHDRYEDDYPPRHLDGEIVKGCITEGRAKEVDPDVYHFEREFGGVEYRLVINVGKRKVLTGYPIAVDRDAAWASGRWSSQQLDDIEAFIDSNPRDDGPR